MSPSPRPVAGCAFVLGPSSRQVMSKRAANSAGCHWTLETRRRQHDESYVLRVGLVCDICQRAAGKRSTTSGRHDIPLLLGFSLRGAVASGLAGRWTGSKNKKITSEQRDWRAGQLARDYGGELLWRKVCDSRLEQAHKSLNSRSYDTSPRERRLTSSFVWVCLFCVVSLGSFDKSNESLPDPDSLDG